MESLQPDNLKMPYNIGHLKKSLLENNFAMPFFGWQNGESVFVIDGHQRREVLSELESEGVKVPELLDCQLINAKDRQEAVKLLLSVFNSKTNPIDLEVLTEWVELEQVEVEITSLNVVDVNEVEDEKQEILEAEEDDFDSTLSETPETVLGDLYEIGDHRLLCGDSNDSDQVAKLMNGSKADMVFTDPPYDLENEDYHSNIFIFTENAHVFVMHDDKGIVNYLRESKLEFSRFYVANFGFSSPRGNDPYLSHILISQEKNGNAIPHKNMYDGFRSIIPMEYRFRLKDDKTEHKHQKPISFIETFIKHFSNDSAKVLDLFLGSGTTMVASHNTKRKCYGMELDCRYADLIIKRMIKLDSNLKVKRNGIDETKKWLDKIK
jgi:DNA modification methylase